MIMILTEAYSAFPQYKLEPAAVSAWLNLFASYEAKLFRSAMHAALKTSVGRFPSPGMVQEFLDQDGEMLPAEAWEIANAASRNLKEMRNALAAFPKILEAARLVGLDRIALCDWESRPFVKRDFESTFRSLSEREQRQELLEISNPAAKAMLGQVMAALPKTIGADK